MESICCFTFSELLVLISLYFALIFINDGFHLEPESAVVGAEGESESIRFH